MENIASQLEAVETKQRNLYKAHAQLHSEASSFLLLSFQWKELEEQYDSTRELISMQFQDLQERERIVSFKEAELNSFELKKNEMDGLIRLKEEKMRALSRDIELREGDLNEVCVRIKEAEKELECKGKGLDEVKMRIEDCGKDFELKQGKLNGVLKLIEDREGEVVLKEKRLNDVEMSIDECSKELELKKNELSELHGSIEKYGVEIRLKVKELDSAQERLGVVSGDIKLREGVLKTMCGRLKDIVMEIELKDKVLDAIKKRVRDCEQQCESKEQQLDGIVKLIVKRSSECELKEKHVESIQTLLTEHEEELAIKEKHYDAIQKSIRQSSTELKVKEKELESIENMIMMQWKDKRLDVIENNIKLKNEELDLKGKEFDSMQSKLKNLSGQLVLKESELEDNKRCIENHSKELDRQEKQLESIKKSTKDHREELLLLIQFISSIEKAIVECFKQWDVEENHIDPVQNSLDDCSNELDKQHIAISVTVHKGLEGLKAKQKYVNILRKSIEDSSQRLKIEEIDLKRRTEELNQKDEELKLAQDEYDKHLKEFEIDKMEIASQKKLLEGRNAEQRLNERKYEVHAKKLESIEKDVALIRDSVGKWKLRENPNMLHSKVKTEESNCCSSNVLLSLQSQKNIDGKIMLFFLCEHLKVHDLVRTGLADALRTSSHPAKLVLEAMEWYYPPQMMTGDTRFDEHKIKAGCIFLSELLLKFSPQIAPPLKEEALELAVQWKEKMTLAFPDVAAFLLLLANYGLASAFNADELRTLLNSVSHYKPNLAVELGQALGIADKCPVGSTSVNLVKLEQPQSSTTNETPLSSFKNEQLSMNVAERRLQLLLNEQLARHDLTPSEILCTLQKSVDPAKLVLNVIRGSFHQQLKEEIGFEAISLGWCRILLEQLMEISPQICPPVKEGAMRLAVDWKSKIGTDGNSSLETVGFLQLLVSYGLTSSFSEEEILKLFENAKEHEQVAELWATFGFSQKMHDLVQNLSGMKQFVEAVSFINKHKLESFQPVQIMNKYLHDASAAIRACKKKETSQKEEERTNKDGRNPKINQQPQVLKVKLESQYQPSYDSQQPTNVGWQLPHPSYIEAQEIHPAPQSHPTSLAPQQHPAKVIVWQPHPANIAVQQPHLVNAALQQPPNVASWQPPHQANIALWQPPHLANITLRQPPHLANIALRQPPHLANVAIRQQPCPADVALRQQAHLADFAMQQPHLANIETPQPHPVNIETPQPHPTNLECRQLCPEKRRSQQYEHNQMKCPRTSTSIRSSGFVNSTPSMHGKRS